MNGNLPVVILGADPELFIFDQKKERLSSAIAFFPKGKNSGEFVTQEAGARVLHDNVAVEFNCRPYGTAVEFANGMSSILGGIQQMLTERASETHRLVYDVGSAVFPPQLLRHREAKRFGCEPDFSAWTSMRNPTHDAETVGNLRVIGGHIHVGLRGTSKLVDALLRDFTTSCAIVKLLDATLGQYIASLEAASPVPSTFVDRRKFYGASGAFRKKPYGLEYRTPSSIWLSSRESMEKVFNIVNGVLSKVDDADNQHEYTPDQIMLRGNTLPLYRELLKKFDVIEDEVITAVNTSVPNKELLKYALSF